MDFKKSTRLFVPLMANDVLSVRRNSHDRLIERLQDLEFMTRSVVQTDDELEINLQILDVDLLLHLLTGEANKFLLASIISHDRSIQDQTNNASWQAVEHYYSAYYAVHYLIRLTGVSLTNLDDKAVQAILKNSFCSNNNTPVPTGMYVLHYENSNQTLTLKRNMKKKPGGSHKDAWKLWMNVVDKLMNETNVDPVEYAMTAVDLSIHKLFLLKSAGKYNPPEIRGEINYQFKGGLWIFEENSKNSIGIIQRSILSRQPQNLIRAATPEGLILNNKFIIGLAKSVFKNASDNYPKSICRSLSNKYSKYFS